MIYSLTRKYQTFLDVVYTCLIRKEFRKCDGLIRRGLSLVGGRRITIGKNSNLGYHCVLSVWEELSSVSSPEIIIGDNVSIGDYCHISATNKVIIGNGVLTGRFVTIIDNNHGDTNKESLLIPPQERAVVNKGPVVINDNVWIGDKVTILPGVKIGNNSVIAANAVVVKDVPPFSVVVGVPGRVVKSFEK